MEEKRRIMDKPSDLQAREGEAVLADLRRILADDIGIAESADHIDVDAPLFSAEVGLSSLDGIELLSMIENRYEITLSEEIIFDDTPSLRSIAQHVDQLRNAPS